MQQIAPAPMTPRTPIRAGDRARALAQVTNALLQAAAQYRINMAVWAGASLLQVLVFLSVWQAVATAAGDVAGYDAAGFAGYFLVVLLVREVTYTWMPYEFEELVQTGRLSPLLLLPQHPLARLFAIMAAYKAQSVAMLLVVLPAAWWAFGASVDTTAAQVAAGLLMLVPALLLRFLADGCLAMSAFWLTRIGGPRSIYYLLLLFLGGQFAPVDALPAPLQQVALALPFWWTLGYPAELIAGRRGLDSLPEALAVLGAWSAVFAVALLVLWRSGSRRYGAVGA